MTRRSLAWLFILVYAVGLAGVAAAQGTGTPGVGLYLPFSPHQTWYVCQGYFGTVTHGGTYSLDLTLDPEGMGAAGCWGWDPGDQSYSAHQQVLAPGAGVVDYKYGTNSDLICLDLDVGGSLQIGHMTPSSKTGEGWIPAQGLLGTTSVANTANGDYSHIHVRAYGSNDCSGSSVPFAGTYRFFGVPDLVDLKPWSALGNNYVNHYFGLGVSQLMVQRSQDDAGAEPSGCTEQLGLNEIYLGNCQNRAYLWSGWRFENLPVNRGEWVTAASLLFQVDGTYDNRTYTRFWGEANSFPGSFASWSMPSQRVRTAANVIWKVYESDVWQWRQPRDTPNLRGILQEIVNRPSWYRDSSDVVLLAGSYGTRLNTHRRVMAYERDGSHTLPEFYPARAIVTQFKTRHPARTAKGNNLPIANAGGDVYYSYAGQKVTLNAGASFDPDGDGLTYAWTKTSGPPVTLYSANTATPYFYVGAFGESYTFQVTVTDDHASRLQGKDSVFVTCSGCG